MSIENPNFSSSNESRPHDSERLSLIAETLEKMQSELNDGRGVSCVRTLISCLQRNDLDAAKAVFHNEHDKIRSYPEIDAYLRDHLLDQEERAKWEI